MSGVGERKSGGDETPVSGSPLRRNDSELVDELAFSGIGLGARTIFDGSSWTCGILGVVMSVPTAPVAANVNTGTSWIERENK